MIGLAEPCDEPLVFGMLVDKDVRDAGRGLVSFMKTVGIRSTASVRKTVRTATSQLVGESLCFDLSTVPAP